jgi:hypothetical protein
MSVNSAFKSTLFTSFASSHPADLLTVHSPNNDTYTGRRTVLSAVS